MRNHDVSGKLKDLLHKIEITVHSKDSTTFLVVGNLLAELQMLATDHDPKRVITILNLIVQLQGSHYSDSKTDEDQKC